MKKFVVYRHRRLDDNSIFYIGIGSLKRAYSKYSRNNHWKNLVNKTQYDVEIVAEDLLAGDACELEVFLIKLYGRKDLGLGNLVNLTDGGEGTANIVVSEEQRKKRSEAYKGESNHFYGKTHSIESIQKIKNKQLGKKASQETIDRMKESRSEYLSSDKAFSYPREGELNPKAKIVLCSETGIFYLTAKEAAIAYNIKYSTLKNYLQGSRLNKTPLNYC